MSLTINKVVSVSETMIEYSQCYQYSCIGIPNKDLVATK